LEILNGEDLFVEVNKCIKKYNNYYWLVAWAGKEFDLTRTLYKNKNKVRKIIVGLHFCQTNPQFIKKFSSFGGIKYIKNTEGIFHPKAYLFENNHKDWVLILGSANFTESAFYRNTEICLKMTSKDIGSKKVYEDYKILIDELWKKTQVFTKKELKDYTDKWRKAKKSIDFISKRNKKISYRTSDNTPLVVDMQWNEFTKRVFDEKRRLRGHKFEERIKMLGVIQNIFKNKRDYNKFNLDERRKVAGMFKRDGIDYGWFGSMSMARKFTPKIIDGNKVIGKAINCIPLSGEVNKDHYLSFIKIYKRLFDNGIPTASRLLAMKRPDVFLCLDSKNRKKACKEFGIKYYSINYESYWNEIIERIRESNWYKYPKPKNDKEKKLAKYRAAFLDSIYYEN
jgi:hypothetical protein